MSEKKMKLRNGKIINSELIVSFDFETTGLNPFHNKIIEIGAYNNNEKTFDILININEKLSKFIINLTKITDEMLNTDGINKEIAAKKFFEFINCNNSEPTYLIGHNIFNFDNLFLNKLFKEFNLNLENVYFIDTLLFARMLLPDQQYFSLQTLCKKFNIEFKNAHRANIDAKATYHLFKILRELMKQNYDNTSLQNIYKLNTQYLTKFK